MPKHVGPKLVYADDDQHRSRPGRLAKHPAFGLLLSPAGYLTPPVDFVTDRQTDRRTDRQTDELKVFWAFYSIFKNKKTCVGKYANTHTHQDMRIAYFFSIRLSLAYFSNMLI